MLSAFIEFLICYERPFNGISLWFSPGRHIWQSICSKFRTSHEDILALSGPFSSGRSRVEHWRGPDAGELTYDFNMGEVDGLGGRWMMATRCELELSAWNPSVASGNADAEADADADADEESNASLVLCSLPIEQTEELETDRRTVPYEPAYRFAKDEILIKLCLCMRRDAPRDGK